MKISHEKSFCHILLSYDNVSAVQKVNSASQLTLVYKNTCQATITQCRNYIPTATSYVLNCTISLTGVQSSVTNLNIISTIIDQTLTFIQASTILRQILKKKHPVVFYTVCHIHTPYCIHTNRVDTKGGKTHKCKLIVTASNNGYCITIIETKK
jgi:hypothetical protein